MQPIESYCVVVQFGRKLIVNTRHFYRSKHLTQSSTRKKQKTQAWYNKINSVNTEHRRLNLVTLIDKPSLYWLKHWTKKGLKWGRVQLADSDRVLVNAKEKESRCEARAPLGGAVCLVSSLKSDKTQQNATKSRRVHEAQCNSFLTWM